MEFRPLDLTVISAEDLKKVNLFSKMEVYTVVSVYNHNYPKYTASTIQKTPIDNEGNRNPTWNFPLKFTIDELAAQQCRLSLIFQIKFRGGCTGEKIVGEVVVPVKELLDVDSSKQAQKVSYQIRKRSGKHRGVLHFSYKVGPTFRKETQVVPPPVKGTAGKSSEPVMAYPASSNIGGVGAGVGTSSTAYPYPPQQQQQYAYPPQQQQQYAYPHSQASYGYSDYPAAPQPGYGYGGAPPPVIVAPQQQQKPKSSSNMGMGMGMLAGALGGFMLADIVDDAFDGGYDDGGYDDGGFDGGDW